MLISKILLLKPGFLKKTGQLIVDLTKRTFNRELVNSTDVQMIVLDESVSMRPDLFSKAAYQTSSNWDALLKFNGISNPFALDHKQLLFVPDQTALAAGFKNSPDITDHASKRLFNQVLNPITKQDKTRLELIKAKPLPNNIVDTTDKNVKVKDGRIIFGEDVTKVQKDRCSGSVSRAKLKEKLLQNQIFTD